MLFLVLMLFFATFSGTATGCLLSWWLIGQPSDEARSAPHMPVDRADHDSGVSDQAAMQWAGAHYTPEDAPLVVGKLRLYSRLMQSRGWQQ
jgi:hypothetical protein